MDDRYYRNSPQSDYYGRRDPQDYTRDYGSGRDYTYSSARDYAAADRGRGAERGRERYGADYGDGDYYGGREPWTHGRGDRFRGTMNNGYRDEDFDRGYGSDRDARGYGSNRDRMYGEDRRGDWGRDRSYRTQNRYDDRDRGFFDRAGDEVRSWFGDDDAERRREMDQRYDERHSRRDRWDNPYGREDGHYHQWRRQRIAELDRDYDEYRRENAERFHNEFASFRSERQTQRDSLSRVKEHMEVLGSDGQHVGTVDKVRGDRILLTKNDKDAGGHHHSIPSRWIESVDKDKVKIRKTADEAQSKWRDEERNMAFFRDDENDMSGDRNLNRAFSGTY